MTTYTDHLCLSSEIFVIQCTFTIEYYSFIRIFITFTVEPCLSDLQFFNYFKLHELFNFFDDDTFQLFYVTRALEECMPPPRPNMTYECNDKKKNPLKISGSRW